jgi:hypothetical protein
MQRTRRHRSREEGKAGGSLTGFPPRRCGAYIASAGTCASAARTVLCLCVCLKGVGGRPSEIDRVGGKTRAPSASRALRHPSVGDPRDRAKTARSVYAQHPLTMGWLFSLANGTLGLRAHHCTNVRCFSSMAWYPLRRAAFSSARVAAGSRSLSCALVKKSTMNDIFFARREEREGERERERGGVVVAVLLCCSCFCRRVEVLAWCVL